jgi:general secretion pathway protein G
MRRLNSTGSGIVGNRGFRRAGFTLLELLIVLAIIVVIAAMVVPNLIGSQQKANEDVTLATIKSIEKNPVGTWAADHDGAYLKATSGQEAWTQMMNPQAYKGRKLRPYIEEAPLDAWGRPLQYEWNGDGHSKKQNALKPAIWSMGANGNDEGGEGDDIPSWKTLAATE